MILTGPLGRTDKAIQYGLSLGDDYRLAKTYNYPVYE
jgi:hypothetical protein